MEHDVLDEQHYGNATGAGRRPAESHKLIIHYANALTLAEPPAASAPADRYFGRLGMSSLRVRYEVMQLKARYETHRLLPNEAEHLLLFTEDALRDWAAHYPKDPWLASTAFEMAQLYAELPGATARDRAVALLIYVKSRFPATPYARKSRDQLHRGLAIKPLPAWAITPSPSPVASPKPTAPPPSAAPSPSARP